MANCSMMPIMDSRYYNLFPKIKHQEDFLRTAETSAISHAVVKIKKFEKKSKHPTIRHQSDIS